MAESSLYTDIARGLTEAIAYERGELDARALRLTRRFPAPPDWTPEQIKRIRLDISLTQPAFASLMGVSIKTVEAWECGRNKPSGCAARLLQVIAKGGVATSLDHDGNAFGAE